MSLYGKEIIVFGDSIYGNNNTETGVCEQIKINCGAVIYNCAFGGTRIHPRKELPGHINEPYRHFDMKNLIDSIISGDYTNQDAMLIPNKHGEVFNGRFPEMLKRIKELKFTNQIITLNHGTNDWSGGTTMENYKGTLKYVIDRINENYPNVRIVLLSPAFRCTFENSAVVPNSGSINYGQGTVKDFANAMKDVAKECQVDFIDCYNMGIDESNALNYFNGSDGTHHDERGRAYLAKHVARELEKIVTS